MWNWLNSCTNLFLGIEEICLIAILISFSKNLIEYYSLTKYLASLYIYVLVFTLLIILV